jgi:hypothetical protein
VGLVDEAGLHDCFGADFVEACGGELLEAVCDA